ncbi:MAG: helix-turn-helix domain-containing protein [Firmicutes bacterium]|nr:helix-turn-helix domain-containing protein [Bacillota bacterium]
MAEATEWVTIQEAADRLKVSKVTIYRWAREGLLAITCSGRFLCNTGFIQVFIDSHIR